MAFDKLLEKNVPHILEKIFFSLDYNSFKASQEVCTAWRELLSSHSYEQKARKMLTENGMELERAIIKGNAIDVERIITKGMVDMNHELGNCNTTLLCFAVVLRQTEVLKLLLEGGADPNWATENGGAPPLYLAVLIGKKDLVELLLNGGAKPNIAVPLLQTRMAGGLTANEMDIFEMLADACANN